MSSLPKVSFTMYAMSYNAPRNDLLAQQELGNLVDIVSMGGQQIRRALMSIPAEK